MSLSSYTSLYITAIQLDEGRNDVLGIRAVRWCPDAGQPEESSVGDLAHWIASNRGVVYLRWPDGTTGPRVRTNGDCLYTSTGGQSDPLLLLPHFTDGKAHPRHRRFARR